MTKTLPQSRPLHLHEGDLLLCEGGPLHGQYRRVSVLMFIPGGLPSSGFIYRDSQYRREGNKWVFYGAAKDVVDASKGEK